MPGQQAKVTVYTTRICPYCFRAKSLLAKRGIAYDEVDVSSDTEKRTWLVQTTGQKTVPQIFIDDASVGGSDELAQLDRAGELVKRVFGSA
jgi:glutaredoxin 3